MEQLQANLRPRRPGFVLTPLIDVIFLLLVFFMLSSQIAVFGLLPITGSAAANGQEGAPMPVATVPSGERQVTLRISRGHVSAGDTTITIDELPRAIAELQEAGVSGVLLITMRSATVQDVVSTLEAFKIASFARVTMLTRQAGGG